MEFEGRRFLVCSVHVKRIGSLVINRGSVDLSWKTALNLLITELTCETPRTRAVGELFGWIDSCRPDSAIIGGDFNTVPFSTAIRKMGNKYDDALWPSINYLTGSYNKLSLPVSPRIDYIFHSPNIKCTSARVIKKSAGDHYPVRAVFDVM